MQRQETAVSYSSVRSKPPEVFRRPPGVGRVRHAEDIFDDDYATRLLEAALRELRASQLNYAPVHFTGRVLPDKRTIEIRARRGSDGLEESAVYGIEDRVYDYLPDTDTLGLLSHAGILAIRFADDHTWIRMGGMPGRVLHRHTDGSIEGMTTEEARRRGIIR